MNATATLQRFSRSALSASRWKNGGGSTQQIVNWPPGADLDAFDWRVSIATIAASGPFSRFDGVNRTIMLLEGAGVQLQAVDGSVNHRLDLPWAPFAFDGSQAVDCRLLIGTSTDFNVMGRRTRGAAELRVIGAAEHWSGATHGLLMSLHRSWRAGDETLSEGDGFWWAGMPQDFALMPDGPDARLVAVRWTPINEGSTT